MNEAGDSKLDLVRKLLAKAESTDSEPERVALMERATVLIAQYGIDTKLLANAGEIRDEVGDKVITIDSPYASEKSHLLHCTADPLGVRTAYRPSSRSVHMFGFTADLERAEMLYTSLLIQATFGLASYSPGVGKDAGLIMLRKSWLLGFANRIRERLVYVETYAQQQAAEEGRVTSSGMELMLRNRGDEVSRAFADAYPKLRKRRRMYRVDGFGAGHEAGNRADLGGTRVSDTSRPALGR